MTPRQFFSFLALTGLVAACSPSGGQSETKIDPAQIYSDTCSECHRTGLAGAPVLGDGEAWSPRIAKGVDTLVQHAVDGFRAMPAKGGNSSLSREEVAATVRYMVDQGQ